MNETTDEEFIDTEAAAKVLKVAPGTLKTWRSSGKGPSFYRIGRTPRYLVSELVAYMRSCAVKPGEARR